MTGAEYANLIAAYVARRFGARGVKVYREIRVGKSIIGKNRCIDVFCVCDVTNKAFAIECKFQDSEGTVDEKIPYSLDDLEAMPMAGCIAYAGKGFSAGVLHMLQASTRAAYCLPVDSKATRPPTRRSWIICWRCISAGGMSSSARRSLFPRHRRPRLRTAAHRRVPRSHRYLPERLSAGTAPKPRQRHVLNTRPAARYRFRPMYVACVGWPQHMARAFDSCDNSAEVVLERSTPAITNKFVDSIYSQLSPVYDVLFGAVLQPGRVAAVTQSCEMLQRTRVLEVGIGTGLGARLFPRSFQVTRNRSLPANARECTQALSHARVFNTSPVTRMDAASLELDANSFDIVYAPYTVSVVPGSDTGGAREAARLPSWSAES